MSVSKGTVVDMLTLYPPKRLDLMPDRQYMSLHRVPFSSPSLHFLGWTKHIVLTHHCLIMLEFTGTPELSSTGLPWGFFLTPHCYCTTAGTRVTQPTSLIQPKAPHCSVDVQTLLLQTFWSAIYHYQYVMFLWWVRLNGAWQSRICHSTQPCFCVVYLDAHLLQWNTS